MNKKFLVSSLFVVFNLSVYWLKLDLIRSITDPEHPLTLEELAVVSVSQVKVSPNHILVEFTPTVPHCGASTLIGMHSLRLL